MRVEVFVEHHLHHLGGLQRVDDEGRGVRRPGNDVDLLALQLVDDRLHARAAHADAGADRIDRGIVRDDRDLGARARIARDRLHLDDAVVDFRHLLREQLGGELRMGAGEENLRAARLAPHVVDIGADAIAGAEHLAGDQFVAPHDRLARAGAAEIDDDVAVFDALDLAVDDLADAILVDVILLVALGLADLLHQHLLGGLGGNASVIERRQRFGDPVADLRRRVLLLRLGERDLRRVVLDLVDDQQQPREPDFAGFRVDVGAHFGLLTIARARRLLHRVLHRGEHDRAVDRFLARDGVDDLQEFKSVGADGHRLLLRQARAAARPRRGPRLWLFVSLALGAWFRSLGRFRRLPGVASPPCSAAFSRRSAARINSSVRTRRASPYRGSASSTRSSVLSSATSAARRRARRSGARRPRSPAKALAAVDRDRHLDPRLMADRAAKIRFAHQRPIDPRRGNLEPIGLAIGSSTSSIGEKPALARSQSSIDIVPSGRSAMI